MKRKILLFALAVISFSCMYAQGDAGKVNFGIGLRLGLPVGDFNLTHSFGVGGEVQGEARVAENISIPFSAGYTSFFGKDFGGSKVSAVGLIPILAGVRVYATPMLFVGGKLGYGILTGGGDSEGGFNYEPQIGYNADKVQVAFGYNGWSKNGGTLSHLALITTLKF